MTPFKAITGWLKQITMRHPVSAGWQLLLNRTRYDYENEVNARTNSIVIACVRWVQRTFPEAPLSLQRRSRDANEWEPTDSDPLLRLLGNPNPFYDGLTLWSAMVADYMLDGNAYILKARNGRGAPVELWWAPSSMIEPWFPTDGSTYIQHYEYRPDGTNTVRVPIDDVIHLRDGIDPRNTRKGLSPLRSLMREVFSDDEAANMTASLMRNMGVPGVVLSPTAESSISQDTAQSMKEWFSQRFSGDRRGEPLVLSGAVSLEQFGFSPEQMNLKDLRRIPEERVTAVLGVPAIVAGLGAGLDRSTFANYAEAREAAYESLIIPMQRHIASQLHTQILPEFHSDVDRWRVVFDLSDVRVLQEDENAHAKRVGELLQGGLLTVGEARQELGYEAESEHDVYYVPSKIKRVPVGELDAPEPEPVPTSEPPESEPAPFGRASWQAKALTDRQQALALRFKSDAEQLEAALSSRLSSLFADLGDRAARAYEDTVKAYKQDDAVLVEQIIRTLSLESWQRGQFNPVIQAHYLVVAETTYESVSTTLGVAFDLPDETSRRILTEGGRRAGLVDMTQASRESLFRTITEARSEGLGVANTAERIRGVVPAGRWETSARRAEVISRTETAHAQRISSIRSYRDSGVVQQVELLDAQIGRTDAECEDRNGRIVSIMDAEQELMEEHPNGTLAILPVAE